MTIAAGFVCMDGIVLCADTQETTGYTKTNTEKIRAFSDQGLGVAITGAGDTELIETIGKRIQHALFANYTRNEIRWPSEVLAIIQKEMSSSFRTYIVPYAAFPKDDRPWCDLLIAVTVKNKVNNYDCFYRATGTTVREIEPGGECVGTGLILAKSLIERFYDPFMGLDDLVLAACYIMYQTKKWVDGCGGKTDLLVASYKKDFFGSISNRDIGALERQFERCESSANLLLTNLLNPNVIPEEKKRLVDNVRTLSDDASMALFSADSRFRQILKDLADDPSPETSS